MSQDKNIGGNSNFDNASLWDSEVVVTPSPVISDRGSGDKSAIIEAAKRTVSTTSLTSFGSSSSYSSSGSHGSLRSNRKRHDSVDLDANGPSPTLPPSEPRGRTVTIGRNFSKKSSMKEFAMIRKIWNKNKLIEKINITNPQITTTSAGNTIRWIITEPSAKLCQALWEYFYDVNHVAVVCDSPFSENRLKRGNNPDAIVFDGNVYGLKEYNDKWWKELEGFVGDETIQDIRNHIKLIYLGEAPLHTCFMIKLNHPTVKYLIYNCAYLTKKTHTYNSYASTWSSFLAVRNHNLQNKDHPDMLISSIASRAFLHHDGEEESAKQMFLAHNNFISPPIDFSNPTYFDAKDEALSRGEKISPDERKCFIIDELLNWDIKNRGFIDTETVDFLLGLWLDTEKYQDLFGDSILPKKVKRAAAVTLAHYAFPEEFSIGIAEKIINQPGALHALLKLVKKGHVIAHREIDPAELTIPKEPIAKGASGKVYKGSWKGQEVAIKVFSEEMLNFSLEEFQREVAIMSVLKHENLISLMGAVTSQPRSLMIITKFITGGSLHQLITDNSFSLPFSLQLKIATEIARGMAFLHSKGIVHRDLKSLNVLIDEGYVARVIDFGSSRIVDKDRMMTQAIGTILYTSPEIFNNEKYTEKADVYSYAILLWELFTRQVPFSELNSFIIPVAVTKGERPPIPKDMHSDIGKLIKACWHGKAAKRPSFADVLTLLTKLGGG